MSIVQNYAYAYKLHCSLCFCFVMQNIDAAFFSSMHDGLIHKSFLITSIIANLLTSKTRFR
ncbi:MAG: hypothetical protein KA508_04380 [Gammaproteobacteria bacterium]|nr:hypothetical protein [Gammaproteobacteria bacterium]